MPKMPSKFICEMCDFKCSKKSNYEKHISTRKHILQLNGYNNDTKDEQKMPQKCECGKEYNYHSGLWRHKKKCIIKKGENTLIDEQINNIDDKQTIHLLIKENIDFKNIILDLVKNNSDFQKQNLEMQNKMIDVCKNSNNTINSHNKTFNMQVFLNEKCKDAMNIMDFVNSMTLELSDLEDVGDVGYVEGISRIIIRKLNEIDVYKRPIHCSDYKREVMYVRDDDIWEKENCTFDKIRKAIKYITKKNSDLLIPWREEHPQCMNTSHRLNDVYVRLIGQAMGGKGEFVDNENKIIKKISKAVVIDKDC